MSDSFDVVDGQVFYRFGDKNRYMLALDVTNVLDEKYAETTLISGGQKAYSPGMPRSFWGTFKVTF